MTRLPAWSHLLLLLLFLSLKSNAQYRYFFGNIHSHSSYSDGCKDGEQTNVKTPTECYRFAKESKHFDFLGISDHNHNESGTGMHLANYAIGLEEADQENDNGSFVCMYGIEFGLNKYGHVLVYGLRQLPGWEKNNHDVLSAADDYTKLWRLAGAANAFATLAHPETEHYNNLLASSRRDDADKVICGVAIANGPHDSEAIDYSEKPGLDYYRHYHRLLAKGYRVGPTIDHDNHMTTFGRTTTSRTVVLATALHRDSIIASYKAMRFYASEDWDTQVSFTIKDKPMGSELNSKIDPVIHITVEEPTEEDPVKYIKIMYGKVGSKLPPKALASVNDENFIIATHNGAKIGEVYYFYGEIRQKDGDRIITSPIWVKRIK